MSIIFGSYKQAIDIIWAEIDTVNRDYEGTSKSDECKIALTSKLEVLYRVKRYLEVALANEEASFSADLAPKNQDEIDKLLAIHPIIDLTEEYTDWRNDPGHKNNNQPNSEVD